MRSAVLPKTLILVGAVSLAVAGVVLTDTSAVVAAEAPGVEWTRQFGTSSDDWVDGMALDAGGVYVAGVTPGALPGQISAGGSDVFLRKYDLDGNEQWTRQFGTTSEDRGLGAVVDTSGVYLTGYTYGALPGYANAGSRDVFVRKYDLDGNELWTRQFGTTGEDIGIEVAVDTGGLYLTGGTMGALPGQSSAGEWDVFVRKYDLSGNEQWTRQFGSISEDWGPGVAVDTGGLYVTGYTAGALPGQSSAGGLDAWVRRYDLDGNEQWTRQFGTTSDDSSAEVVVDAVEAYLVGDTMGTLPGQSSAGSGDVFLRKYDLDGNEQWTRQFGTSSHDSAQDMTMDTSGVYLTGHTRGAFPGQTHAGAKDVWVRHYDRDGIEQWTLQFGTNADDWGLGVATDTTGGMYLTGPTRGALPGHGNAGGLDVFVRKYHPDAIPAPPLCGGKPATIVGTEGDDDLRGTDGDDVIVGLGGDDLIKGRGGNDTLCGNAGKDTLVGGPGDDVLRGGGAYDRAGYSLAPTGVTVDLESGVATGWGTDKLVSIEFVLGSAFDDHLFGDGRRNFLRGGDGDDLLIGRGGPDWLRGDSGDDDLRGTGGNDTVDGWDGNDTLDGGNGDDLIRGMAGADRLIGGSGDDRLEGRYGSDTLIGGPGDDRLDGGIGSDWVAYGTAPIDGGVGVKVNLDTGTATGGHGTDELRSIENIIGSRFNDELYGTDASNVIKGNDGQDWISGLRGSDHLLGGPDNDDLWGGEGDDVLEGHGGSDYLDGGSGDDLIRGGADSDSTLPGSGNDTINGGTGWDSVRYLDAPRGVVVDLGAGTAAGFGDDTLTAIENAWGSEHDDVLIGNGLDNLLRGWTGNDVLRGRGGNDYLQSDEGDDALHGGNGDDLLDAWEGNDRLYGGTGHDDLDGGPGIDTLNGGPDHDECTRGEVYESCEVIQ